MPNIPITELSRLRQIESRVRESKEFEMVAPFTELFIENVGVMLATIPRDQWPSWVNTAFNHAAGKFPHGAMIYTKWHKA